MIIASNSYFPPWFLRNGHLQTIFPTLFRKVNLPNYERIRIETPDADFLDLDFSVSNSSKKSQTLVVLSHGLEGNSHRTYITGMVNLFNKHGYDCLAWNFRSCSGEINKNLRFYHSGATDDLATVLSQNWIKSYESINLVGFSLGGNLTLKFLGENDISQHFNIKKSIVFSVPLHLSSSSRKLAAWDNWIYNRRFNKSLEKKIRLKSEFFPKEIGTNYISKIKNLKDFDDYYTSKLHGFVDAEDYYTQNSSIFFLDKIKTPTLIVNAQNDPFLSKECFPYELIGRLENVHFESPEQGGHCGFYQKNYKNILWSEQRAIEWFSAKGL